MKRRMLKADVSAIDGLSFEDAPLPDSGPGEVRVMVRAVSHNARDVMVIEQGFLRLPEVDLVAGSDMSGVVDAIAQGVTGRSTGDHVMNLHFQGLDDDPIPADAGGGLGSLAEQTRWPKTSSPPPTVSPARRRAGRKRGPPTFPAPGSRLGTR